MFGLEEDLYEKLAEANKRIDVMKREAERVRKALGIVLIAMEQFDNEGRHQREGAEEDRFPFHATRFQGAREAVKEALWPGPLTVLAERRLVLEEELAKVIGEIDMSFLDHKGKAVQVLLACNRGEQNCRNCPIVSCCDNDTEAARIIKELSSASDIGRDRLVEMIEAARRVRNGG